MKNHKKMLPIGIDNFQKLRTDGFYYVDKTGLIIELLHGWSEVTLFTRPRRFGKTLNMSMLEAFFSPDSDKRLFSDLIISGEKELCDAYRGQFPVVSISLKSIDAGSFETAFEMAVHMINETAFKIYDKLKDSENLLPAEKILLAGYLKPQLSEAEFSGSLRIFSRLLEKHYKKKVIILIDEYDVPLAKAYEQGYYEQMVLLIRGLFQQTLKTNSSMKFAVMTGCMRISKESIFTGLNNLNVRSVSDAQYDEYFGFTDTEVKQMLEYYGFSSYYAAVKDWYDGYRFGQTCVYCPWDVISYCEKLRTDSDHSPENFWLNSSGNYAVKKFIEQSRGTSLKGEIEALINGEAVEKTIRQDLTYQDMYDSDENIWSVLYTTGYLTQAGRSGSRMQLVIPNREICNIFSEQILELFREDVRKDETLVTLCDALQKADTGTVEKCMNAYLRRTISIRDTAVRRSLKENFYHGILLGILSLKADWTVLSNQEAGNGYSDIQIRDENQSLAMVLEVKYADDGDMNAACVQGLKQIEEKHYTQKLRDNGFKTILKYGMAFFRKECMAIAENIEEDQ